MVRRFLLILFDTFILFIIFISLFQFAGANMNLGGLESKFDSTNYFGFQSLFTFFSDLGNNENILTAWNDGIDFSTKCIRYVSDNLNTFWKNVTAEPSKDLWKNVVNGYRFLWILLSAPVALGLGIGGIVVFVIRFVWEVISLAFKLLLGYYNVKVPTIF